MNAWDVRGEAVNAATGVTSVSVWHRVAGTEDQEIAKSRWAERVRADGLDPVMASVVVFEDWMLVSQVERPDWHRLGVILIGVLKANGLDRDTNPVDYLRAALGIKDDLDMVRARIEGAALGCRDRAADGCDVDASEGSARAYDYALRLLENVGR